LLARTTLREGRQQPRVNQIAIVASGAASIEVNRVVGSAIA
jgi:hypothetical protein